jgi:hypothetical protein
MGGSDVRVVPKCREGQTLLALSPRTVLGDRRYILFVLGIGVGVLLLGRVKHYHGDCPELTDSRVFGLDQHGVSRVISARPGAAKHGGRFGAPREPQVSRYTELPCFLTSVEASRYGCPEKSGENSSSSLYIKVFSSFLNLGFNKI